MTEDPRARPSRPASWRDLLRPRYDYPEDLVDQGAPRGQRRRQRRAWRRRDRRTREDWLRDQRGTEPVSPAAVLILVAVLTAAVVAAGALLPRLAGGLDRTDVAVLEPAAPPAPPSAKPTDATLLPPESTVAALTPAAPAGGTEAPTPLLPPASPPPAPNSSPAPTEAPGARDANTAARAWTRAFLTRHPAVDKSLQAVAERTAPYATAELVANLSRYDDQTFADLAAGNRRSIVNRLSVEAPPSGTGLPPDTPSRVYRLARAEVAVIGTPPSQFSLPLMLELIYTGADWRVSRLVPTGDL